MARLRTLALRRSATSETVGTRVRPETYRPPSFLSFGREGGRGCCHSASGVPDEACTRSRRRGRHRLVFGDEDEYNDVEGGDDCDDKDCGKGGPCLSVWFWIVDVVVVAVFGRAPPRLTRRSRCDNNHLSSSKGGRDVSGRRRCIDVTRTTQNERTKSSQDDAPHIDDVAATN